MEITSEISEVGTIVGPSSLLLPLSKISFAPPFRFEAGRIEDTRVEDPSDFQTSSIGFRVQLYDEKYDDRDGILNSDVPKQIRFVIISNNFHFKFNIQ